MKGVRRDEVKARGKSGNVVDALLAAEAAFASARSKVGTMSPRKRVREEDAAKRLVLVPGRTRLMKCIVWNCKTTGRSEFRSNFNYLCSFGKLDLFFV